MESLNPRGYTSVLHNRHFLALWMAQVLSNTALNGAFFLQIVLIEDVTGSSGQLAAVTLAFSLPAVLLSALAGLIVDRFSKKWILIASNAFRFVTGALLALLASFLLANDLNSSVFLAIIYVLVFLTSAIGQFFAPAEGATIPLIVPRGALLSANSLFTITFTASQILGTIILAPLGIKVIGLVGSLWIAAAMYVAATALVALIPRDRPARSIDVAEGVSTVRSAWREIVEGWHFAITHAPILVGLLQLALVYTLTMIMVVLAPGYAARVLGLSAEDAIYVFWPSGLGMLLASIAIGRYGNVAPRQVISTIGMFILGLAMVGLAWAGGGGGPLDVPLFRGHPDIVISATAAIMFFALIVGIGVALINIPAQTVVQEQSSESVRGRVLALQFTLSNAIGILPLLFVGNLADRYGIPRVTLIVAATVTLLAFFSLAFTSSQRRVPTHAHSSSPPDSSHPSSP